MAEAFLQVVLDNLSSLIKEEIGLILGVDEEMQKLCNILTTIQAVLEDAELKQVERSPIRDWLRKLNLVAYEIDDILDDCNAHFSKLNHAPSKLSCYSLNKIQYRSKIAKRMKQVTQRLDSVAAERTKFHLQEMQVDRPREVAAAWRETSSLLNETDNIYGREEDKEKIVKMLVEDARDKQEMSVLPIIGVGGLGKTTLAQQVFNDPRVEDHFERRIWVYVSDNFDIKTLVKAMIESATGSGKALDLKHLDAPVHCSDNFPIGTLVKFNNLKDLKISGAEEISVPGEGCLQALNKLEFLSIEDCETMRCIPEGLLRHLTALRKLYIYSCPELVELPENIKHLHNLQFIELMNLRKMVCLPEALQHLPSLRSLYLYGLPELESLPDWLHQLTHLIVSDCGKVVSLPAAIPNLKDLTVWGCPELERRCTRGSGEEWHKIANIPRLQIGHQ